MVEEAETNLLIHSFSLTFSLALLTSASTKVLPISAKFVQASCLVEQPTSSSSSPPWKETSSGNDETTNKAEFVREMFEGGSGVASHLTVSYPLLKGIAKECKIAHTHDGNGGASAAGSNTFSGGMMIKNGTSASVVLETGEMKHCERVVVV
ncbi:hypothetical protein Fcan01_12302 [Folsomia candida]|uniref:Uncharacterized protein n=1 Tax=Folsomia candida TaxID=158441 RepID=A0A226E762_FOLCA|nr:hypothetical protein Fcan01_12302 [Folsomia candida]